MGSTNTFLSILTALLPTTPLIQVNGDPCDPSKAPRESSRSILEDVNVVLV